MKRCLLLLLGLLPGYCFGQDATARAASAAAVKQARYARLDRFARELPEAQASSLDQLAASLATQARGDADSKARLIFSWLAYHIAYDADSMGSAITSARRGAPTYVLRNRRAVCAGYANLFTALAQRMKLEAETVVGHARTHETIPDSAFSQTYGHAWNAYRAAGTWHLADATWGAGYVTVTTPRQFEPAFNPYWFDVSPAQAIFDHIPDKPDWQLLPVPEFASNYKNWPYISPDWFSLLDSEALRQLLNTTPAPVRQLPRLDIEDDLTGLRFRQLPLQAELVAGQPVTFTFQAAPDLDVCAELGAKLLVFKQEGSLRQLTLTPPPQLANSGTVRVFVTRRPDNERICSLEYRVLPAAPSPADQSARRPARGRSSARRKLIAKKPR